MFPVIGAIKNKWPGRKDVYVWWHSRGEREKRAEMGEIYGLWFEMKSAHEKDKIGESHLLFNQCSDKLAAIGRQFDDLKVPSQEVWRFMPISWW